MANPKDEPRASYRRFVEASLGKAQEELSAASKQLEGLPSEASEKQRQAAEVRLRSAQARFDEALKKQIAADDMDNGFLMREFERDSVRQATDMLRMNMDTVKAIAQRLNEVMKEHPSETDQRTAWTQEVHSLSESLQGYWRYYYYYGCLICGWAWKEWAWWLPSSPSLPATPGPNAGLPPPPGLVCFTGTVLDQGTGAPFAKLFAASTKFSGRYDGITDGMGLCNCLVVPAGDETLKLYAFSQDRSKRAGPIDISTAGQLDNPLAGACEGCFPFPTMTLQ